jgi:hypothetical protein
MRSLVLWAGQYVLYWLWFSLWPIVAWRWTRRAYFVPSKELTKIKGVYILTTLICIPLVKAQDAWLFEIAVSYYLSAGFIVLKEIYRLVRKYSPPIPNAAPKSSDDQ